MAMLKCAAHNLVRIVLAVAALLVAQVLASAQGPTQLKTPPASQPVDVLRIVVVDVSGSMGDPDTKGMSRLDTARGELLQSLKSLPASPRAPVVLIPFSDDVLVDFVQVYTNNGQLERSLALLQPNGSTNIAAGLKTAIEQAKRPNHAKNLVVFLYSDGQHNIGPMALVYEQEGHLDQLFADRATKGLSQSVVLKRWAGVNADMVAHFQKNPHVRVVDAGELELRTVTLTPSASIQDISWQDAAAGLILVRLTLAAGATGAIVPAKTAIAVACPLTGCQWSGDPAVVVGAPPRTLELLVKLDPRGFDPNAKYSLPLQFQGPGSIATKTGLLLPILYPDRLDCPLPLDRLRPSVQVKATLATAGDPSWKDPLQRLGIWPMRLRLEPTANVAVPWPIQTRWELSGTDGAEITSHKSVVLGSRPLEVDVTVTRQLSPQQLAAAAPVQLRVKLAATVVPKTCNLSSNSVIATATVGLPPTTVTKIAQQVSSVGEPQWTDLTAGVVTVPVRLDLTIDGPLSPGAVLGLLPCRDVVGVGGVPVRVHSGTQAVDITVVGRPNPAPAATVWSLQLQPPPATASVRYVAPAPVAVSFVAPPPVQVVLVNHRGILSAVACPGGAPDQAVAGRAVVQLVGGSVAPGAAKGLIARGIFRDGIIGSGFAGASPGQEVSWAMRPGNPPSTLSWWRDVHVKGSLVVLPENASANAVQGSVLDLTLTYEALYKKLAMHLTLGLGAVLVGVILYRLVKMCVAVSRPKLTDQPLALRPGGTDVPVA